MGRRMLAAALLAAAMGSSATPVAAEPVCVTVYGGVTATNTFVNPLGGCFPTMLETHSFAFGQDVPGVGYVWVVVRWP